MLKKYERADREKQIEFLAQRQEWKCACCGRHAQVLCLDHCHKRNAARAMLCFNCNTALGMMRESPLDCLRLAAYATKCEALAQEGIERTEKTLGVSRSRIPKSPQDAVLAYLRRNEGASTLEVVSAVKANIGRNEAYRSIRSLERLGKIQFVKGERNSKCWSVSK